MGTPCIIEFWDHAEDCDAIHCKAIGWVYKVSKTVIELLSWDFTDPRDRDPVDDPNLKRWSIVRSAISSITPLKPDVPLAPTPIMQ